MWLGFFAWYRALALGGTLHVSQVQLLQPFLSMLLAEPTTTNAQPLIAAFLLDPSPVVRGFWRRTALAEMTIEQLIEA